MEPSSICSSPSSRPTAVRVDLAHYWPANAPEAQQALSGGAEALPGGWWVRRLVSPVFPPMDSVDTLADALVTLNWSVEGSLQGGGRWLWLLLTPLRRWPVAAVWAMLPGVLVTHTLRLARSFGLALWPPGTCNVGSR